MNYRVFHTTKNLGKKTLGNHYKIPRNIVFIDSGVDDYQSLVNGAISEAEVIILDSTRDGVAQITESLQGWADIASIHIVSHGSPGCLYLGNTQLSLNTLERYAIQLQSWAATSLRLYGCNVAVGDAGEEFIERVHRLTGANIAASARRVGNPAKGGSWDLEYCTGQTDTGSAFLPELMQVYSGVFVTVDTLMDNNDGNFSSGQLSLREAIDLGGTVNFAPSLAGGTISLSLGELLIDKDLTIQGLGVNNLTVSGNNAFRVFNIDDGNSNNLINVTIQGLTIANGNATLSNSDGRGGGIFNRENLTVFNSTISGNTAVNDGGGIHNSGILTVTNSSISGNTAEFDGGGIDNFFGIVTVTNSNISDNKSEFDGGGIDNFFGIVTVTNSSISGNTSEFDGGGIFNDSGTLRVTNSSISGNTSEFDGGGIANDEGIVIVTNTTISGNTSEFDGGGIFNDEGTVTVTNSSISGNTSEFNGGGIFNDEGTLTVFNSTISGNTAVDNGGGIDNSGTLTVTNSTITANTADSNSGSIGDGGGIYNSGIAEVKNTIIAGNFDTSPAPNSIHPDVSGSFSTTDSNLIGNATGSTGFTNGVNGNIVGSSINPINPQLGPLQNNGGSTFTHALLDGSPAINAGNNANIPAGITTDQRGEPRIVSPRVDIGAFEAALPTPGRTIDGTSNDDDLTGTPGNDTIRGFNSQDTLRGGAGNDLLDGGDGDDKLYAGTGNDTLLGGSGQDQLFGDAGDDLLNGGAGDNKLTGGTGSDIFVLFREGKNTILDFEDGIDKLRFSFGAVDIKKQGNDTLITTKDNQPLALLIGMEKDLITAADFTMM